MKNNITELVFIIDRSGSMAGLEKDTIGGFNSLIQKQLKQEGECYVTTVLFDDRTEIIHDRVELKSVKQMTEDDYYVRGCTALIDAIGSTVQHISDIHRYIRPEDVPQNTMFVITTDGAENASINYELEQVKRMIEQKKELGWEFLFIGANIDAISTATAFGINANRSVRYRSDRRGTSVLYNTVSNALFNYRETACLEPECLYDIAEDYMSSPDEE